MKPFGLIVAAAVGLSIAAFPVFAWARAKKRAGNSAVEQVAAVLYVENGPKADDDAHRAVAEVFWRNAAAAEKTPTQVLAGNGGPLAPWPTATAYKVLIAGARLGMLANETNAKRLVTIATEARGENAVSAGGTNWTHGSGPFEQWLEKGYTVVASFKVPSAKRPYLWVYKRPNI